MLMLIGKVGSISAMIAIAAMASALSAGHAGQTTPEISAAVGGSAAPTVSADRPAAEAASPYTWQRPVFSADGVAHVPSFDLPPSALSSAEAQAFMKQRVHMGGMIPGGANIGIAEERRRLDAMMAPQVAGLRKAYPVDVEETTMAGVPVRIVTPHGRKFDPTRVLVNLHGGGFALCWDACSLLESVPIAALGGYKVVSVNYRMAPEAAHPAAIEDAAAVYQELLRRYPARRIGVYGCSAGGALTAELAAWLPRHKLPQPGGAGIFGAGGLRFQAGDSAWIAASIDGSFPPPPAPGKTGPEMSHGYFAHADMSDPLIAPALHPDVIAKFPPTLIITGTRAPDMSPAIVTNSALIKAGVPSTLIVGEGMGHCYIYQHQLPEARDAYAAIVGFFGRTLR